jgi:iron complex outermembrane receptor protein
MRLIICCFVFSLSLTIAAQNNKGNILSGKIINAKSAPVPRSTVYLLNTHDGTISDERGNFSFKNLPAGKYVIQVSAVGYATIQMDVSIANNSNESLNIQLVDAERQLDAVLVTAQKTEEFVQKIPLSITAISSRQAEQYRLWKNNELTAIVPNLYSANPGDGRNVTSIRGITTTSYEPSVATYIDGVNQFSLDTYIAALLDVERIEILRGPQGTLYGRNAMGGVINIITKQPTNARDGFAEITAGNCGRQRYSFGYRAPLIKNKLFISFSGLYDHRNGFYNNQFNNSSFDRQGSFTGNYYLSYMANKKWVLKLNIKNNNNRNNGAFPLVNGVDETFNHPFQLTQNAIAKMIDNTFNSSFSIHYTGRTVNFSSQTAYQYNHRHYDRPLDGDFSPIDGVTIINNYGSNWNNSKVLTQEFKFSSPAATTSLKWTGGIYFFHQNNPVKQATHFGKDAALVGAPDTDFSIINTTKAKNSGVAFFGQLTYSLNDKLDLIGGLRYDYENKKYNVLGEYQKDPNPDPLFETRPDTSASIHFEAFSPKLGLAYKLSVNSNLFATYSRGYRTGGLTQLSSDPSQPPLFPYRPEYSNNIEAGVKNTLFNKRLFINITLFLTYVNDAQVPTLILPDAITITRNAGKLTSKGTELELTATPAKGLQVDYSFGYTDAVYKNLSLSQNGSAVNLAGNKQIFTPDVTSMLAPQYTIDLGTNQQLKLIIRGEWMHIGKQFFDLANTIVQKGYNLLNIRFGISAKKKDLMFWIRNTGDKKYIAYAYDFGAIHLGNPKTYGVSMLARF